MLGLEYFIGHDIQWYIDQVHEIVAQWETYGTYDLYQFSLNRFVLPAVIRQNIGYGVMDFLAPTKLLL